MVLSPDTALTVLIAFAAAMLGYLVGRQQRGDRQPRNFIPTTRPMTTPPPMPRKK